jgi:TPR repeat protein
MRKLIAMAGLITAVQVSQAGAAFAGPWEDGMAAYNRGDYVPAIGLFRPLAEQGNPSAQSVLGVMYWKGQGVAKSSARAFMWFSLAAARGDRKAKVELQAISKEISAQDLSRAHDMMQACEASNGRNCEY